MVFHMKGWCPKSLVSPSKPRENRLFGRIIPGFLLGCPGRARKPREKQVCVQFVLGVVLPHLPVGKKNTAFLSCVTWLKLTKID